MGGTSIEVDVFSMVTKKDEDDLCLVFSTMEDFKGDGRLLNEVPVEETEMKNLELLMVEKEA